MDVKVIVDYHNEESANDVMHDARTIVDDGIPSRKTARLHAVDLLSWAREMLPQHFRLPPSAMHRWLAERLDGMRRRTVVEDSESTVAQAQGLQPLGLGLVDGDSWPSAGIKLNVVGPRGSAKSTVATLAFVLREALSRSEPYIWIVSDTKHQAAAHLENVKTELADNQALAKAYPEAAGVGPIWRSGAIVLKNGVMIEALGTGQRIRGRRRKQHRPTLIVCDDLQNDGHIQSAFARDRSRNWFHGLIMKAGTKRTNIVNLGTALHRECLAMELTHTPGWISQVFRAIQTWPDDMPLWHAWEEIYCDLDGLSIKPPMVSAVNCEWTNNSASGATGSAGPLDNKGATGSASVFCDGAGGIQSELAVRTGGASGTHVELSNNSTAPPIPSAALCNNSRQLAREFYLQHKTQMDAGAVVLWPEVEDLYTLMCMRAESGSTAFEREKQSTPVNPELCEWPESYFGDWIWFDEWPEGRVQESGIRSQRISITGEDQEKLTPDS